MIKKLCVAFAAGSVALAAVPAAAQSTAAPAEEPRTTYRIVYLKFNPGGEQRWRELRQKYFIPAGEAAKLPPIVVHTMVDGPWDVMLLVPLPRGMASLDTHNTPEQKASREALIKIAGSEEAANKIVEERDSLIANSSMAFSHTHP